MSVVLQTIYISLTQTLMKSAVKSVTDFSFFPAALDQVFETQTCPGTEEPAEVSTPEWKTHCFYLSDFRGG